MISEIEVREKLLAFLGGEIGLDDFEDWLIPSSWNMHLDSTQAADDLVASIELVISEYTSDHRTYADLQHTLQFIADKEPSK